MSRKTKKSRRRGLLRFDAVEFQVRTFTGEVKVVPLMAADVVKAAAKPERVVFAKPRYERIKLSLRHPAPKPTMAETVASIAVKQGTKAHIEPLAAMLSVASVEPRTIQLLGQLVVASTISSGKALPQAVALGDRFIESIANRPFEVEVSATGKVTTRMGSSRSPRAGMRGKRSGIRVEVDDNVTVKKRNGNTTYIFNTLNVYITGKIIQQVNVNPESVINNITGQLTSALEKKVVKGKRSPKPHGLALGKTDDDYMEPKTEAMKINVSKLGAELQSLRVNQREYLWQGDSDFWGRRAPILFPIVGRVADDTLRIDGKSYTMKQHGFARDAEFEERDGWYVLTEEGRDNYPYAFELAVKYVIEGNSLDCKWQVKNLGDKPMHFQIGAHPAFLLPDYDVDENLHGFIRFYDKDGNTISPLLHHYLDAGLRRPYDTPMALNNDEGLLALNEKTFENDALLIEGGQVASAALLNKAGHEVLRVSCPQAEAFGIWAPNKPGCPFVCIEPWCGIADKVGFKGEISERDCIHNLVPNKTYEFDYSIQIILLDRNE